MVFSGGRGLSLFLHRSFVHPLQSLKRVRPDSLVQRHDPQRLVPQEFPPFRGREVVEDVPMGDFGSGVTAKQLAEFLERLLGLYESLGAGRPRRREVVHPRLCVQIFNPLSKSVETRVELALASSNTRTTPELTKGLGREGAEGTWEGRREESFSTSIGRT